MKMILFLIVFNCISCTDTLQLTRTSITGNQLRLDGYYYDNYASYENLDYIDPIILYSNGIILHTGVEHSLRAIDSTFLDEKWLEYSKNRHDWWGIYQIEGNSIKIEKLYHSNAWFFHAYIRSGKILNDTTFIINSVERSGKPWTKEEKILRVYHFRHFSIKPDSTNRFIKY